MIKGLCLMLVVQSLSCLSPEDGYKPITGCGLALEVSDVASLWEQMKSGSNILHPIRNNDWGNTSFRIADPEGFAISFFTKH